MEKHDNDYGVLTQKKINNNKPRIYYLIHAFNEWLWNSVLQMFFFFFCSKLSMENNIQEKTLMKNTDKSSNQKVSESSC